MEPELPIYVRPETHTFNRRAVPGARCRFSELYASPHRREGVGVVSPREPQSRALRLKASLGDFATYIRRPSTIER